jgi:hypothetical protein
MGRIEQTLFLDEGRGSTPTDLRTFARNRTLAQEATDVSIYDKGPGLRDVSGPVAPRLFKILHPDFREFPKGEVHGDSSSTP